MKMKLIAFFRRTTVADCPKCHKHFYLKDGLQSHITINHVNYRYICHRCHNAHTNKS